MTRQAFALLSVVLAARLGAAFDYDPRKGVDDSFAGCLDAVLDYPTEASPEAEKGALGGSLQNLLEVLGEPDEKEISIKPAPWKDGPEMTHAELTYAESRLFLRGAEPETRMSLYQYEASRRGESIGCGIRIGDSIDAFAAKANPYDLLSDYQHGGRSGRKLFWYAETEVEGYGVSVRCAAVTLILNDEKILDEAWWNLACPH